jgi:small subunit ribosomal protein S16
LLAIKLMRIGAKKNPFYRIVVKEKLSKRDGAYLENIGYYNPTRNPAEVRLDTERVKYWIERGAQPTDTVRSIIRNHLKTQSQSQGVTA